MFADDKSFSRLEHEGPRTCWSQLNGSSPSLKLVPFVLSVIKRCKRKLDGLRFVGKTKITITPGKTEVLSLTKGHKKYCDVTITATSASALMNSPTKPSAARAHPNTPEDHDSEASSTKSPPKSSAARAHPNTPEDHDSKAPVAKTHYASPQADFSPILESSPPTRVNSEVTAR